jgi:hypothetical protein
MPTIMYDAFRRKLMKKTTFGLIFLILFAVSAFSENANNTFYSVHRGYNAEDQKLLKPWYQVKFPEKLDSKYRIESISIGVGIGIKTSNDQMSRLDTIMLKAIDNEQSFKELSSWKPYRQSAVHYKRTDGAYLIVATLPTSAYNIVENMDNYEKEQIVINEYLLTDKTKYNWRIIDIKDGKKYKSLSWSVGVLTYLVMNNGDDYFTKEDATKIAEEIQLHLCKN